MNKYRFHHALIKSLYSKSLYLDVCKNWKGLGFSFIALIALVVSAARGYELYSVILKTAPEIRSVLKKERPVITIKSGKMTMVPDRPLVIGNPYSEGPFAVLDGSGKINWLEDMRQGIYLGPDTLYIVFRKDKVESYDLSDFDDTVIDRTSIERYLDFYTMYFYPIALFLGFGGYFFEFCVISLGMGLAGLMFARVWKAEPDYVTMVRLGCVCLSPAALLESGLALTHENLPYEDLLFLIIPLIYLNVAVRWCYGKKQTEETSA